MSTRTALFVVTCLFIFLASCMHSVTMTVPEEHVVGNCLTIERVGGAEGDITFSFALPRDCYLDVKWAYSYFSFESPVLSEAIREDGEGNVYFRSPCG
jgi:hypothetical protein